MAEIKFTVIVKAQFPCDMKVHESGCGSDTYLPYLWHSSASGESAKGGGCSGLSVHNQDAYDFSSHLWAAWLAELESRSSIFQLTPQSWHC